MEQYESDYTEHSNKKYKCIICEKQHEEKDTTLYKYKQICRKCIEFFKKMIIFYGNINAWHQKRIITNINEYALDSINDDRYTD